MKVQFAYRRGEFIASFDQQALQCFLPRVADVIIFREDLGRPSARVSEPRSPCLWIFSASSGMRMVRSVGVLTSLTSLASQLQSELGHFRKVLEELHDQGRLPKKCLCTEPHTQATGTFADGGLHVSISLGSGSACWRRCVAGLTSTDSL